MLTVTGYRDALAEGRLDQTLSALYGGDGVAPGHERCAAVLDAMQEWRGDGPAVMVSAPGRTELGGNHTDHNHGVVLAAAVHFDCLAVARPTDDGVVRVHSEGFSEVIEVELDSLAPHPDEAGTSTALVRGVAHGLVEAGYALTGFDACITGNVPVGSGLSSSACFEVCIGRIFSALANNGTVPAVTLAQIGQRAENVHFGKPCGLMDQTAASVQGVVSIDFNDPADPAVRQVDFDFSATDYQLVVVDTGGDHADLTPDYAAITEELALASRVFGQPVARGLTMADVFARAAEVRQAAGDRGLLRLIHFVEENDRAVAQADCLRAGDMDGFLRLVRASGRSSLDLLQNCYSTSAPQEQPIPLALALSERVLEGRGAWRVHGGGFAGTIQAFVPVDLMGRYVHVMESVFGPGCVVPLTVRMPGNERLVPGGAEG